jgi:hypothetical protein
LKEDLEEEKEIFNEREEERREIRLEYLDNM